MTKNELDAGVRGAIAAAQQSKIKRARVGCAILLDGMATYTYHLGWNQAKTHPALARLTDYPYLHAESAAILKVGLDRCKCASMVIVRLKADGSFGLAKPCSVCRKLITIAGIKEVYYSTGNGDEVTKL